MSNKSIFFTPQYPTEPGKGMGYIEIETELVMKIGISAVYKPDSHGGFSLVTAPDGTKFKAYCDNPYSFGGRNKRRFTVYSHGEIIQLTTQKKLTIDAVLFFVRSWAENNAKVITPGKRTITLSKEKAEIPGYVYFILNPDSNAIKIGIAKNISRRLANLQTSNAARLELLGSIQTENINKAKKLEKSLHEQFSKFIVRGEWFHCHSELLQYISDI